MSEIMHENYVDRLYAGTLNEDDAKRADELVAENARLTENLRVLRGKVASLMDENAIIANERNAARDENARLTEKFAVKTARLSTELRIGMEQRDAALAENARLVELMKAALDVLNAHRDEKHAVPARVRPQERLLEDAFETAGCVARFVYYTGPRPKVPVR
jgi:predicted  nucleic acid-binding Zn-ribbon protein